MRFEWVPPPQPRPGHFKLTLEEYEPVKNVTHVCSHKFTPAELRNLINLIALQLGDLADQEETK